MARATKKQRNKDSSAFTDAVAASAQLDGTGVEHDAAGPVYRVALTESQHRAVGDELAATLLKIEELKAEKKKVTKEFKDDIGELESRRDVLRDEWRSGQRKTEAQATLPGTVDA